MKKIPKPVRMWIYSHECAHQFRGPNEEVADCFAVQRGRRRRWLSLAGLEQVCKFISPATGDSMHFSTITLPDNVKSTISDRDFTLVTIVGAKEEEPETIEGEEVEGEGEEAAEGEAEGEEKAEGDDK